jgi:hypothetical protein
VEEPERGPALEDQPLLDVVRGDQRHDVGKDVVALDDTGIDAVPVRDFRDLRLRGH